MSSIPRGNLSALLKIKKTTPRERAEALGSRHTVDSLCFRDEALLLLSCLVCVCWCFPGSTVVPLCQPTNHKRAFEVISERDYGQTSRPLHSHTWVCQTKTTLHKNHPPPLAYCSHSICQSFSLWPKYCGSQLNLLRSRPGPKQFPTVTLTVARILRVLLRTSRIPHIDECTLWNIYTVKQLESFAFVLVLGCTGS